MSGCFSDEGLTTPETGTPVPTDTPTETLDTGAPTGRGTPTEAHNCSTPRGGTVTSSPHPDVSAEDALPEPRNGWQYEGSTTSNAQWLRLIVDSTRGMYTSPDGGDFVVDVFMKQVGDRFDPGHARRYPEIGWDVGVVHGRSLFIAGTGTYQLTHTPEKPPRLDRTPVAGSDDRSRELLSHSPILTEQWISRNGITCGD
jgi:hypothetical protein